MVVQLITVLWAPMHTTARRNTTIGIFVRACRSTRSPGLTGTRCLASHASSPLRTTSSAEHHHPKPTQRHHRRIAPMAPLPMPHKIVARPPIHARHGPTPHQQPPDQPTAPIIQRDEDDSSYQGVLGRQSGEEDVDRRLLRSGRGGVRELPVGEAGGLVGVVEVAEVEERAAGEDGVGVEEEGEDALDGGWHFAFSSLLPLFFPRWR